MRSEGSKGGRRAESEHGHGGDDDREGGDAVGAMLLDERLGEDDIEGPERSRQKNVDRSAQQLARFLADRQIAPEQESGAGECDEQTGEGRWRYRFTGDPRGDECDEQGLGADDQAAHAGRHEFEAVDRPEVVAEHADEGDRQEARPIPALDVPCPADNQQPRGIDDAHQRVADDQGVGRAQSRRQRTEEHRADAPHQHREQQRGDCRAVLSAGVELSRRRWLGFSRHGSRRRPALP